MLQRLCRAPYCATHCHSCGWRAKKAANGNHIQTGSQVACRLGGCQAWHLTVSENRQNFAKLDYQVTTFKLTYRQEGARSRAGERRAQNNIGNRRRKPERAKYVEGLGTSSRYRPVSFLLAKFWGSATRRLRLNLASIAPEEFMLQKCLFEDILKLKAIGGFEWV